MYDEWLYSNRAKSKLAAGFAIGASTITLETGDGALFALPSGIKKQKVSLFDNLLNPTKVEIVEVSSRSSDALTVSLRGAEGTTEQDWAIGDDVVAYPTKGNFDNFAQLSQLAEVSIPLAESVDLATAADNVGVYTIEAGYLFFPTRFSCIILSDDTVTTDPDVSIGTSSGGAELLSLETFAETNQGDINNADSIAVVNGLSGSIYFSVKVAATATALTGIPFVIGRMFKE